MGDRGGKAASLGAGRRPQGQPHLVRWRLYWKAGQIRQCVDGAFSQPMPDEMVDRGVSFGPNYTGIEH